MDSGGLGSFWGLVVPDFGAVLAGGVEAVTPILVLIIWSVAAFVIWFAVRQAQHAKGLIRQATKLLEGLEPATVSQHRGEIAQRASLSAPLVRDAWREFDETLVTENRRIYNTVDAAEYFNEQHFAPRLVGNRFLHAAPTALTTLGLLGTFLGLTVGLRGLDLGASSDELRVGIQTLVDGAALGFTASLWGVAMSLATNVIERWQERQVVKRTEQLQARINGLFTLKSPEQSLSDIAASSFESKEALQVLHEKIGGALQESVHHIGENTSRAVTEALQATLAPIMHDIAQAAANQSADVFKEVSAQLTASFNQIGVSLAEQLKASSDSMRSTLDYMGEKLSKEADEHLARLAALEEATSAQLLAVNEATARQLTMLDEALPKVVTGLEQTASLVGFATTEMKSATSKLADVSTALGETSVALGRTLATSVGTMDELSSKTAEVAAALSRQQDSVSELIAQSVAAAQTLERAAGSLSGGFDGMRGAQAAFLVELEQQLLKHSGLMAGWLASYGDEVGKQTDHRMDEWNRQTERFTSTMLNATQAMSEVVDELGSRAADERVPA